MIKTMERLGDRLLERFVPNVTANADPCECSGSWTREIQCYCNCGAGAFGWSIRQKQHCSGCRLTYGSCYDTWHGCIC
jgi:hypothetical protein